MAQKPLVQAAGSLSVAVEKRGDPNFGGIALGSKAVELYWKGEVPGWLNSELKRVRTIAPVEVKKVTRALSERREAAKAVIAAVESDPQVDVQGVSIPVGSDDIVVQSERDPEGAKAFAHKRSKISVKAVTAPKMTPTHRLHDAAPFSGGAMIGIGQQALCTAGWPVSNGANRVAQGPQQGILTARHCGAPASNWWTPGWNGSFIGNNGRENFGHDIMVINSPWVSNRMYDGGNRDQANTQFFKSVVGWVRVFPNEVLCTSGAVS